METGFPSGRTPTLTGAVTRHLLFVLFDALQVDKRTDEGGGGREEEEGACIEEEKQVRHGYLVSAIFSQRRQGDKRKKRQREEGSAAGKVICLWIEEFFWPELQRESLRGREDGEGEGGTFTGLHLFFFLHALHHLDARQLDRRFIHQRPLRPTANINQNT